MKETFYLKHDYNSRNDEKILKLRRKYKNGSGYAAYWMILEKLAESSEGRIKLEDIEDIAFELQMDSKWITDVIQSHNLFKNDGIYFWSDRLLEDLADREAKSKQATLANKIRWDKARKEATNHPSGVHLESKDRIGEDRKGDKVKYGEAGMISLTAVEYRRLKQKIGSHTDALIQKVENWKLSKKKNRYDDDYRGILNWIARAKEEGKLVVTVDDFLEEDFDTPAEYEKKCAVLLNS